MTRESDAQGRSGARDGTVGVVHNVIAYHRGQEALCQWQRRTFQAKPLIPRICLFTGEPGATCQTHPSRAMVYEAYPASQFPQQSPQ